MKWGFEVGSQPFAVTLGHERRPHDLVPVRRMFLETMPSPVCRNCGKHARLGSAIPCSRGLHRKS